MKKFNKKRKILAYIASATALVTIPAAAFAWSVNTTHFPTPAAPPKTLTNINDTGSSDSDNTSGGNDMTSNDQQQPVAPAPDNVGTAQNHSSTQVTVNGQDVPVPTNGSVNQTVTNDSGSPTDVSISHTSTSSTSGSGTSTNHNSISIQTNSSSTKNIDTDTPE